MESRVRSLFLNVSALVWAGLAPMAVVAAQAESTDDVLAAVAAELDEEAAADAAAAENSASGSKEKSQSMEKASQDKTSAAKPKRERIEVVETAPVIEPYILRLDLEEADIDAQDFEVSIFWGQLSVEDFGVSDVFGGTLAYHISEDLFLEAAYATSKLQSSSAETLGNFDLVDDDKLSYYDVSVGYVIMPGETFIWKDWAFNSSVYAILGYGNTDFVGEKKSTLNFGAGYRLVAWDWLAIRLDVRDHIFQHELFVHEKTTNNFEMRAGVSVFF